MKKNAAFSLLEMLTVLSMVSILLLLSLGLWKQVHQKSRMERLTSELSHALRYARNNALSKGLVLTLAPLQGKNNWSLGIVLFEDNKNHQPTPESAILTQWLWAYPGIHLAWKGFRSNNYLSFAADLKNASSSGRFVITNLQGHKKEIIINRLGHIHVQP